MSDLDPDPKIHIVDAMIAAALAMEDELERQRREPPEYDVPHCSEDPSGLSVDVPRYRLTELGNAQRLADTNAGTLRYIHEWKSWIAWDGKRWVRDASGAENEAAKLVVEQLFDLAEAARTNADHISTQHADVIAAAGSTDKSTDAQQARNQARSSSEFGEVKQARAEADLLHAWAISSSSAKVIGNMIKLARSEPSLVARPADLDLDPWLINVQNGTLDLRTCELRPHRQADMITRIAAVNYDPDATSVLWEKFLEQIHPDPEMRDWLQRFMGYCLTGNVSEQIMMFALGVGSNGKNVMLDTMLAILGDYGMVAPPDLLVLKHNEEHPTAFADLQGYRLVVVSEIEHGRKWAEATIKRLTGDKTVKARKMRQDFYEFLVTFKFVVLANSKPEVRGTDNGIWRRILLVLFGVTIADKDADTSLLTKLQAELDGIFAWAVRGFSSWQRERLGRARPIRDAVAAYRAEQDVVGEWIAERCICVCLPDQHQLGAVSCETCGATVHPRIAPVGTESGTSRESWNAIYPDFRSWMESRGDRAWTLRALRAELIKRTWLAGYRTNTERGIEGLKLRYPAGMEISSRSGTQYSSFR